MTPVMYVDPNGNIAFPSLFAITIAAVLIGGIAQIISNAMTGKTGSELWRGVAGAAMGAGTNALVLGLTLATGGASIFLAAGVSAIVQTGTDTIETLIRGETIDWGAALVTSGVNFASTSLGNFAGGKMVHTNRGWFQPQQFFSIFSKSYGQKILVQTLIGACISGSVNYARKYDWSEFKPVITGPVVTIWGQQ